MTARYEFYAEQAFLSFVKRSLTQEYGEWEHEIEQGVACLMACGAALEALVNSAFRIDGRFGGYDELRLESKIEVLADFGGAVVNWGERPWQKIRELIKVRNRLAHYKDPNRGLINAEGEWLPAPRDFDPEAALSMRAVSQYYDAVRAAAIALVVGLPSTSGHFGFLQSEHYEWYLIG